MKKTTYSALSAFALALFFVDVTLAVSVGQADDFQDGTTMDWGVAGGPGGGMPPVPPANSDGGPAGAGDLFLRLTSTGSMGAGSKMVVLNAAQWTGDYLTAGITGISMDVKNFGPTPLDLRLRFEHFSVPGPPTGDFISAQSVPLASFGEWQSIFFPVSSATLADLSSGLGDDFATTLSDVGVLRILHAPDVSVPGPAVESILGVDNITAVPEPNLVWCLYLIGLLAYRQ